LTLCIAAACDHEGVPAIVLLADWREEEGYWAGAQIADKLSWIVPVKWASLEAGSAADSAVLRASYIEHFASLTTPITRQNTRAVFNDGFKKYRWALVDRHLRSTLAISYNDLVSGMPLASGKSVELPQGFLDQKLHEIEKLPFPLAPVIIAGFTEDGTPILCVVNESPESTHPRIDSNFVTSGCGATAATMSLYRRGHAAPDIKLMEAVYHVFEASSLAAEMSDHVGEDMQISVMTRDGECWSLTQDGLDFLEHQYDYFGPIPLDEKRSCEKVDHDFRFDTKYFEPYRAHWHPNLTKKPDKLLD
jgi:hypothetical protein